MKKKGPEESQTGCNKMHEIVLTTNCLQLNSLAVPNILCITMLQNQEHQN